MRPEIPLMCRPASLHRLLLRDSARNGSWLLPLAQYEKNVRERLPQAVFKVLPDVGHVPMFDDPDLVARTILTATGAAKS